MIIASPSQPQMPAASRGHPDIFSRFRPPAAPVAPFTEPSQYVTAVSTITVVTRTVMWDRCPPPAPVPMHISMPQDFSRTPRPSVIVEEVEECEPSTMTTTTTPKFSVSGGTHRAGAPGSSATIPAEPMSPEVYLLPNVYSDVYQRLRVEHVFCRPSELELLWGVPRFRVAQFCNVTTSGRWNSRSLRKWLDDILRWINGRIAAATASTSRTQASMSAGVSEIKAVAQALSVIHEHLRSSKRGRPRTLYKTVSGNATEVPVFMRLNGGPDEDRLRAAAKDRWQCWTTARAALCGAPCSSLNKLITLVDCVTSHAEAAKASAAGSAKRIGNRGCT